MTSNALQYNMYFNPERNGDCGEERKKKEGKSAGKGTHQIRLKTT